MEPVPSRVRRPGGTGFSGRVGASIEDRRRALRRFSESRSACAPTEARPPHARRACATPRSPASRRSAGSCPRAWLSSFSTPSLRCLRHRSGATCTAPRNGATTRRSSPRRRPRGRFGQHLQLEHRSEPYAAWLARSARGQAPPAAAAPARERWWLYAPSERANMEDARA